MPDDVFIRAMALYSSSDHASETVKRCINHSMTESDAGIIYFFTVIHEKFHWIFL